MRRPASGLVVATAGLLTALLAACSSGTSGSSPGSNGNASPTTAGEKAAAAFLAKYTTAPSSIGNLSPLAAKPPTGKRVIYLQTPGAVAQRSTSALTAAAKPLGWSLSAVSTGATPASAVGAFQAAIARRPDAIIFAGYPAALFTKQIAAANSDGIAVISDATGDGPTPGVLADLGGRAQEALYGKLVAAYFVVQSKGAGKAAVFNIQALPILTYFVTAFQASVREWCSACATKVVDQQLTDEATKTPANVVAFMQRNPKYKWAVFGNGDLSQGVRAAITSAGLQGVSIAGEVPTEANVANIKNGAESAWAGYTVDILNWRLLDILARHYTNTDVAAAAAVPLSLQMLTSANVKSAAFDNGGYYLGVADFPAQFKKIWRLN